VHSDAQSVGSRRFTGETRSHVARPLLFSELLPHLPAVELPPAEDVAGTEIAAIRQWNESGHRPQRSGFSRQLPRALTVEFHADSEQSFVVLLNGVPDRSSGPTVGQQIVGSESRLALSIRVAGAYRLRLHLGSVTLPPASDCWVSGSNGAPVAFGTELLGPDHDLWTPSVLGDTIRFYVSVPKQRVSAQPTAGFVLDTVLELLPSVEAQRTPLGTSCAVDGTCVSTDDFDDLVALRGGVARIDYVESGASYTCSGGLLNDRNNSNIPYFLTADRCASSPAAAASVETFWDYTTPFCGADPQTATASAGNGATVLATSSDSAFTLLQLLNIPSGRFFLGWTTVPLSIGTPVYRISFLGGGPESYSQTTVTTQSCATPQAPAFLYSQSATGVTGGNDVLGAPLVIGGPNGPYVVGQAWGTCGVNSTDYCDPTTDAIDGAFPTTFTLIAPWIDVPSAAFTFAPPSPVAGQTIQFIDESGDSATAWQWTFADGTSSTLQNPTHIYQAPGVYSVSLTAVNNVGQTATTTQSVTVVPATCATCVTISGAVTIAGSGARIHGDGSASYRVTLLDANGNATQYGGNIDANGNFRVSAPSGNYQLLCTINYTDHRINGIPDRPGVATARQPAQRYAVDTILTITLPEPLVLLHGWNSSSLKWNNWLLALPGDVIAFTPGYSDLETFEAAADDVVGELTQGFQLFTSMPSYNLIAHSKGGLIGRILRSARPPLGDQMRAAVLLGTPNDGTDCLGTGLPALFGFNRCQITGSALTVLPAFNQTYPSFSVPTLVIAGTASSALCLLDSSPNDGVVPVESVVKITHVDQFQIIGQRFTNVVLVPAGHTDLGSLPTLWLLGRVILPYFAAGTVPAPACPVSYDTPFASCVDARTRITCLNGRGLYQETMPDGTVRLGCSITSAPSTAGYQLVWTAPSIPLSAPGSTIAEFSQPVTACETVVKSTAITSTATPAGLLGYAVYRASHPFSIVTGTEARVGVAPPDDLSFFDPSPPPGQQYYAVSALYDSGESTLALAPVVTVPPTTKHRAVRH
jgi:PKD repeat protein